MKIQDYRLIASSPKRTKAQTAIEYLLLFAVVAVVVLVAFRNLLPRANVIAGGYYNKVAVGIMGVPPPSADFTDPGPCDGVVCSSFSSDQNSCCEAGNPAAGALRGECCVWHIPLGFPPGCIPAPCAPGGLYYCGC